MEFAILTYSDADPVIGTVANYACLYGYSPTAPTVLECHADRKWMGSVPNCTLIECERPANQTGRFILPDKAVFLFGENVTFACYAGFTLTGFTTLMCTEYGWNRQLPICLPDNCGLVPVIEHGLVSYVAGSTYQQEAYIDCEPGYNLTGSHTVVCTPTKTWAPVVPTCNVIGTTVIVHMFVLWYCCVAISKANKLRYLVLVKDIYMYIGTYNAE